MNGSVDLPTVGQTLDASSPVPVRTAHPPARVTDRPVSSSPKRERERKCKEADALRINVLTAPIRLTTLVLTLGPPPAGADGSEVFEA